MVKYPYLYSYPTSDRSKYDLIEDIETPSENSSIQQDHDEQNVHGIFNNTFFNNYYQSQEEGLSLNRDEINFENPKDYSPVGDTSVSHMNNISEQLRASTSEFQHENHSNGCLEIPLIREANLSTPVYPSYGTSQRIEQSPNQFTSPNNRNNNTNNNLENNNISYNRNHSSWGNRRRSGTENIRANDKEIFIGIVYALLALVLSLKTVLFTERENGYEEYESDISNLEEGQYWNTQGSQQRQVQDNSSQQTLENELPQVESTLRNLLKQMVSRLSVSEQDYEIIE